MAKDLPADENTGLEMKIARNIEVAQRRWD
jgi:hypothetical protein